MLESSVSSVRSRLLEGRTIDEARAGPASLGMLEPRACVHSRCGSHELLEAYLCIRGYEVASALILRGMGRQ